jgi:hypothetical protein
MFLHWEALTNLPITPVDLGLRLAVMRVKEVLASVQSMIFYQ